MSVRPVADSAPKARRQPEQTAVAARDKRYKAPMSEVIDGIHSAYPTTLGRAQHRCRDRLFGRQRERGRVCGAPGARTRRALTLAHVVPASLWEDVGTGLAGALDVEPLSADAAQATAAEQLQRRAAELSDQRGLRQHASAAAEQRRAAADPVRAGFTGATAVTVHHDDDAPVLTAAGARHVLHPYRAAADYAAGLVADGMAARPT